MKTEEIQIRDPFILPDETEGLYYLFGTTGPKLLEWPGAGIQLLQEPRPARMDGPHASIQASGPAVARDSLQPRENAAVGQAEPPAG